MEMSNPQPQCTIRHAFPLIPTEKLAGLIAGLTVHDPITSVAGSPAAYEPIADWMLRHPAVCLGTSLPGLWLARDEGIESATLPVRIITALAKQGITVWGEVLDWSPSFLFDLQGFGEGCLLSFLTTAVQVSAEACGREMPPSRAPLVDTFEPRCLPPSSAFRLTEFRRLVDWAVNEAQALTFGDFVSACSDTNMPEDISLLLRDLRLTQLCDMIPGIVREERLEKLVFDLSGILDKRSQTIFQRRISLKNALTLNELGTEFGVSRERIRQLSVLAEEKVRQALLTARFVPVGWRAHKLRQMLGIAVPFECPQFDKTIRHVMNGVSDAGRERVQDFLLWLAGPYSLNNETGWLQVEAMPQTEILEGYCDERGRVDLERLREHLKKSGLLPSVIPAWIEQFGKIRNIEGNWLIWTGTVADKAIRLLDAWERPATPEEIVNTIDEGHEVRATRSRLFEDKRVMRVDMNRIGLRSWGLEEYSTIAEEIDQELDLRGGTADLDDLVATLVARFSLREASVRLYVYAPMFILEGNTIRRRTDADPPLKFPPITELAGCYIVGPDTLTWRIEVTNDTLRGSGRLMPPAIASWLGITPGNRLSLSAKGGSVCLTWPATSAHGASLGSIRLLIEAVQGAVGDQALICFQRDTGTVTLSLIDRNATAIHGIQRLSLLTGIPFGHSEDGFLYALGLALGTKGTRASVIAEMIRRGETELAALVPPEHESPELDAAIEALKDLF